MPESLDRLLEYIRQRRSISFDQLHEYTLSERLRFDADPISVLYFEGAKRGWVEVDYDQQMIYSRRNEPAALVWAPE